MQDYVMKILFSVCLCATAIADQAMEKIFTCIYESGPWDESGFYYSGSQIEITRKYVDFLQEFLHKNHIHSVVDIGCGDWAFSRYIDWSGIQYTGIDIVKFVIERNQRLFEKPSIVFLYGDALEIELPDADLVLCKDVFQHLPNEKIIQMLKKFKKYPHCLITDYVDFGTNSSANLDIECGKYHTLDLTKPPFNVKGEKVFRFTPNLPKQTVYIRNQTPLQL
jgi:SAM-dependent methyltransferase